MPQNSSLTTLPAPLGGWNARDNIAAMSPQDAIELVNLIPQNTKCVTRGGYRIHSSGMGGNVETITEYVAANGTRRLIAAANGNLWNATTLGGSATSLGSGFTNNKWQTVNFRTVAASNRLILVNGADPPQHYDGTNLDAGARPFYTGIGTESNLISVFLYQKSLVFIEKDSTSIWYGTANALKGALTQLDFGGEFKRGGHLLAGGTWAKDSASGSQDLMVLISSVGEVLVYGGTLSGTFTKLGHFFLPAPVGRRSVFNVGADFVVITELGLYSLKDVFAQGNAEGNYNKLSDKINLAFSDAGKLYGTSFGWEGLVYPGGNIGIINIPVITGTESKQYVWNIITGSWCQFCNIPAICWTIFNQKPYFGGSGGYIYEFDYGKSDLGNPFNWIVRTSFNQLSAENNKKQLNLFMPFLTLSGATNIIYDFDFDYDIQPRVPGLGSTIDIAGSSGSLWDTSYWDVALWASGEIKFAKWLGARGTGRAVSLYMIGGNTLVSCEISGFNILYTNGGYF